MTPTGKRQGLRTVVLSDQALTRAAVSALLRDDPDIADVQRVSTVDDALTRCTSMAVDAALIACAHPGTSVAVVGQLRDLGCSTPCLVIADDETASFVRGALGAGALGVMTFSGTPTELSVALQSVVSGISYVHPTLGAMLALQEAVREIDALSPREREVLRLIALGYTNPEIAARLVVSVRTIETHRAHLARKLRADTRAELVRHALNHGLLSGE